VTLLERLLGHDHDTTREILDLCATLNDAQMDQPFDAGLGSLRSTLEHMVFNIEVWTAMMREEPLGDEPRDKRLAVVNARFEDAHAAFAALARQIDHDNRLDDTWVDFLDNPPQAKSFGGAIGHVLVHNTHHRAELLHMLARLGIPDLPEGDLMGWEKHRHSAS
jgi:uncharacterized damage-inducible protein DinB